jgi:hypothetical protein
MGGNQSSENHKNKGNLSKPEKFYAELVNDGRPTNVPNIKVFIGDQVAMTALGSLKSSEVLAHEISKSLVVDLLKDPANIAKFGILLRHTFQFEYLLQPTRGLIYWSLKSQVSYSNIYFLTKSNLISNYTLNHLQKQAVPNLSKLVKDRNIIKGQYNQLITQVTEQEETSIKPISWSLSNLIQSSQVSRSCFNSLNSIHIPFFNSIALEIFNGRTKISCVRLFSIK